MHFRATLFMSNYAFLSVVLFTQVTTLASQDRQYVLDLQNPKIDTSGFRRERRQSASNGGTTDQTSTTPPTSSELGTDEVHIVSDDHRYYTLRVYKPSNLDQEAWPEINNGEKYKSGYLTAVSRQLPFKFPFYGHMVNSVYIASGGFLYMGSYRHQYLSATQYIAPLMGDFDPEYDESSGIYHKTFENIYGVEWRNVYLHNQGIGPFHFQLYLFENGTIAFVYRKISGLISDIDTSYHPVKVGLADAFFLDTNTSSGKIRRTIYEYHRIAINQSLIEEGSVVILSPLPTCNLASDCETCITLNSTFDCKWCDTIQRCSDGVDRHREDWLNNNCIERAVSESCTQLQTTSSSSAENSTTATTSNVTTAADNTTATVSTTKLKESQSPTLIPSSVEFTAFTIPDNVTATTHKAETTAEVSTVSFSYNVTTYVEVSTASVTDNGTATATVQNVTTSVEVSTISTDANVTTTIKLSTTSVADNTTIASEVSTASVGDNATAVAENVTTVADNITTTTDISATSVVKNATTVADNVTNVVDNVTTIAEVSTASSVGNVTIIADNTTTSSETATSSIADNTTFSVKVSTTLPQPTANSTECDTSGSVKCTSSKPAKDSQRSPKSSSTVAIIVIVVVVIVVVLLGAVGGWCYYACSHAESSSGIWLNEHLPSKIRCWKSSPRERYELQTDY